MHICSASAPYMRFKAEVRAADLAFDETENWDLAVETLVNTRDRMNEAILDFTAIDFKEYVSAMSYNHVG